MSELFQLIDPLIEIYLTVIIKPIVKQHEIFYTKLNTIVRSAIDKKGLPKWCTANFITYVRTILIIPCLLSFSRGMRLVPSLIVLLVDFGDFLDGVVARYWVDERKKDGAATTTHGTKKVVSSWTVSHRDATYGGFVDAVCDKAFVVPCWIYLLSDVVGTRFEILQYFVLWFLILAETASGCVRFKAFYTSTGVPAPKVNNLNFSTSAVKADHVGKAKQTFEMVGTALFTITFTRLIGLAILIPAVPLAYESVRRKIANRTMYVDYNAGHDSKELNHQRLKFWMQAKGMGSKLIVGVTNENDQLNACACACVDSVVTDVPQVIDLAFLEEYKIGYVVCRRAEVGMVSEEVLEAQRCLAIGEDGVAFAVEAKGSRKQ
eukprot:CAMPEP_0172497286 /NCGR_PEP_ID=MMETSP1066-20121228/97595_1 /TAXON_ID=671091 /ORGANISM="Coscinodiscus wailesii, Strain CCMP2513" /LENGTH=375 /DNA_ID=CAMNT_0013269955 /DNA_START=189 /DNA_END=1316 /DNA_ORIENTATION=-